MSSWTNSHTNSTYFHSSPSPISKINSRSTINLLSLATKSSTLLHNLKLEPTKSKDLIISQIPHLRNTIIIEITNPDRCLPPTQTALTRLSCSVLMDSVQRLVQVTTIITIVYLNNSQIRLISKQKHHHLLRSRNTLPTTTMMAVAYQAKIHLNSALPPSNPRRIQPNNQLKITSSRTPHRSYMLNTSRAIRTRVK